MNFKLIALIAVCISFTYCTFNCQTNTSGFKVTQISTGILDVKNEYYSVKIAKVNREAISNFTNSHHTTPYLGIKAECISLKELLGIIRDIEPSSIIMNEELENQFFSVFIHQSRIDEVQDSSIKSDIIKALELNIDVKTFNFDSTIVSVNNREKYLQHANKVGHDKNRSVHTLSQEYIEFENMQLKDILGHLSEIYDKVFVLETEEPQRINFKIKRNDWSLIKVKLESDLGLNFNEYIVKEEKIKVTN